MDRNEAIEVLAGRYLVPVDDGADEHAERVNKALDIAIEELSDPKIVYCMDCVHNVGLKDGVGFWEEDIVCDYWDSDGLQSYDFCSHGERKDK